MADAEPRLQQTGEPKNSVLVVDDDPGVRLLVSEFLLRQGYEILTASDGAEGLRIFRSRRREIALVFLDVSMPVMGGVEAFFELRQIDPAVRVLFASGDTSEERAQALLRAGAAVFLHKPFTLGALSRAIAATLEQGAHGP